MIISFFTNFVDLEVLYFAHPHLGFCLVAVPCIELDSLRGIFSVPCSQRLLQVQLHTGVLLIKHLHHHRLNRIQPQQPRTRYQKPADTDQCSYLKGRDKLDLNLERGMFLIRSGSMRDKSVLILERETSLVRI